MIIPLIELLIILSFPFGLYFFAKWVVRSFDVQADLLRRIYLIYQPLLAVSLFTTLLIHAQYFKNTFSDRILGCEFFVFYFTWPLSCAIYHETRKYHWERLFFWFWSPK